MSIEGRLTSKCQRLRERVVGTHTSVTLRKFLYKVCYLVGVRILRNFTKEDEKKKKKINFVTNKFTPYYGTNFTLLRF